jgi:hypothetical protein
MIVRGPDVTFVREADPAMPQGGASGGRLAPFQKWNTIEGLTKELMDGKSGRDLDRVLEIQQSEAASSLIREQRMEVEFGLGFGLGKRIKKVTALAARGEHLVLRGDIQIWQEDVSRFTLELDRDYVVRRAEVDSDVAPRSGSSSASGRADTVRARCPARRRSRRHSTWSTSTSAPT